MFTNGNAPYVERVGKWIILHNDSCRVFFAEITLIFNSNPPVVSLSTTTTVRPPCRFGTVSKTIGFGLRRWLTTVPAGSTVSFYIAVVSQGNVPSTCLLPCTVWSINQSKQTLVLTKLIRCVLIGRRNFEVLITPVSSRRTTCITVRRKRRDSRSSFSTTLRRQFQRLHLALCAVA